MRLVMRAMLVGILGLLTVSCSRETPSPNGKTYTIPQGGDYAEGTRLLFSTFSGTQMERGFRFDASAKYEFTGAAQKDQADINKLFGFSDCGIVSGGGHQENSARFGWRWYDGRLEILAYTYAEDQGDKPHYQLLGTLELGKIGYGKIEIREKKYVFTYNGVETEMPRGCANSPARGYTLFPYFGGNQRAPHEIKIELF